METKKLVNKSLIAVIILFILVLAGINIFQHKQIKKLSENTNHQAVMKDETAGEGLSGQVETIGANAAKNTNPFIKTEDHDIEPAVENNNLPINKEPNSDEIAELEYQLQATEEELDMTHQQLSERLNQESELLEKELELRRKELEQPYRIKMRRDYAETSLYSRYAPFFNTLNLSPEKLDKFKELLIDEEMASKEYSVEIMEVPDRGKQIVSIVRSKDPGDEYQIKISELLGGDEYAQYQEFKAREGEAYWVSNFNDILKSDEKLTDDQQMDLIYAMRDNAENIRESMVNTRTDSNSSSEMTEEDIELNNRRTESIHEGYIDAANGILTESQVDQLSSYLKGLRDSLEESRKLTSQLTSQLDDEEEKEDSGDRSE